MNQIEQSEYEAYCPVCTRCLKRGETECPGCLSPKPPSGWEDIRNSSLSYLGKVLDGRYVVDRFLGSGTTGDVYRGLGKRIQRPFALKIVDTRRHQQRKDFQEELRARLDREVEAMSRLHNPHVVSVYEFFQVGDPIFVLVMDFVEGVTLQERLDRTGRLEVDESLEIVRQVANGLHEAHQRGIIHRDLKPDNIMIEQMPAKGMFARLLDFGIAYMVDEVHRTSGFRGTPLYASPEQCHSRGEIDARSDLYSLGCVLFHCLTGNPPFDYDRSLAVMEAHLEEEIPSIFDVLERSEAPRRVDHMVRQLLAKDPEERPDNCGEVITRLDEIDLSYDSRDLSPQEAAALREESLFEPTESSAAEEVDQQEHERVVHLVASLELPEDISADAGHITTSALGPGGDYAVLADRDCRAYLVGLKSHLETRTLNGAASMITALAIDSNRGEVYAGGFDSQIVGWNLDRADPKARAIVDIGDRILALDVDQRGFRLAIGTDKGRTLLYDLRTERLVEAECFPSPVSVVRFAPGREQLFIGTWEGSLATIDIQERKELRRLESLEQAPITAAIDPDGRMAAMVDESRRLRVVSLVDAEAFLQIEASFARLEALSFAPNGELNGLGFSEGNLQLWLVRNKHALRHLADKSSASGEAN
ncbi:MAG: WD40 repeat domain-containing serine/threonine protein kinase [Persicimonas sp.]